jgi:tetratricopeptide (TPR) repeat protein
MKKGGINFGHTDEQGRPVEVGTLALISYTVTGEEGDRIRVRQNGVEGWFQKGDAVLLDEAIPYLTERIHSDPNDALAFARRGVVWMAKGDLDSGIKDLSEAIRLAPDNADAHYNRGNAYQARQEYDRAIHDYDDAVRLDPRLVWAYTNRGNAYAARQEYDRAIHDYDDAIRLDPRFAWAYNNRGFAYQAKQEYDRAIHDYDDAVRLDPKNALAYTNRGNAYAAKQEYNRAIHDYDEVTRLDPENGWPYNNMAWLWATCPKGEVRNGKKAVEYARKACDLTTWKEWTFIDTLAAACAEDGQFEEAIKWQKRAMECAGFPMGEKEQALQRVALYESHKPYRE